MFLLPTTTEEVTDIIHNLKNSTSVGHDNISIKLIKSCAAALAPVLAHINNQSLTEGIFPDAMKIAKVVPIFKNSDANNVSNYRPISVLPVCQAGADPEIYFEGGQTKVPNRKLRAKPESRARSARVSRAKPESRARSARELRAKPEPRAKPEKKRGEGVSPSPENF